MMLAASQAAHVVVDQFRDALTLSDSRWAIGAVLASVAVAATTLLLALFTRRSVLATENMLANQTDNFRKDHTVKLINQYFQVPMQLDANISITLHNAHTDLYIYSQKLDKVKGLKAAFAVPPADEEHNKYRRQYRVLVGSVPLLLNFYLNAAQLYAENVLDKQMFLNRFTGPFLRMLKAIETLNPVTEAIPAGGLTAMEPLKGICENWLKKKNMELDSLA